MIEVKGKIEKISERKTRNGKRYWVITVDGKEYSVWDEDLIKGLSIGDLVEISWTEAGKFLNVNKIEKLLDGQGRIKQIIKLSCLRLAIELLSNSKNPRPERVLSVARAFEDYVNG